MGKFDTLAFSSIDMVIMSFIARLVESLKKIFSFFK